MRPRRTVGANLHLVRNDLPRQRRHMLDRARSRARQSQIERVDPQRLHQMKNFDFLGDRRIAHRRRLQPIAQALIIQQHRSRGLQSRRMILVPVVDEFREVFIEVAKELRSSKVSESLSKQLSLRATVLWCWVLGHFSFGGKVRPKTEIHSLAGDIHFCFRGIRQIESLAMFAAIDFGVLSTGFFNIAANLFDADQSGRTSVFKWPPQNLPFSFFSLHARCPAFLVLTLWWGS